jgi:hypothetical protein
MWLSVGLIVAAVGLAQVTPRMDRLVAAVRPLLPYPAANADGDLPVDNSADSRWFVVWPTAPDDNRIIVRGNPLHPDVQKASAEAMEQINAAVTAAERRAQAAYERALEQLRKTGKSGALDNVSLDDEGIAGERIDAELEVNIELASAESFEIASGQPPAVGSTANGTVWMVTVPANTYRAESSGDQRERFRAAETHVYVGLSNPPTVTPAGSGSRFRIAVAPSPAAFVVVIRGNAELVSDLTTRTDWAALASR